MDYEKKYKDALERAKGLLEGMKEGNYNALEDDIIDIFPELKERGDEKMIKALADFICAACTTQEGIKVLTDWFKEQRSKIKNMNYEQKYKNALERAEKIYNSEFKPDEAAVISKHLPAIFPEIKERIEQIKQGKETMITIPQSEFEFLLFCKQRLIDLHDAKIQKCYEEMQQRHVETIVNSYD